MTPTNVARSRSARTDLRVPVNLCYQLMNFKKKTKSNRKKSIQMSPLIVNFFSKAGNYPGSVHESLCFLMDLMVLPINSNYSMGLSKKAVQYNLISILLRFLDTKKPIYGTQKSTEKEALFSLKILWRNSICLVVLLKVEIRVGFSVFMASDFLDLYSHATCSIALN